MVFLVHQMRNTVFLVYHDISWEIPSNTKRWYNIVQMLYKSFVFAGIRYFWFLMASDERYGISGSSWHQTDMTVCVKPLPLTTPDNRHRLHLSIISERERRQFQNWIWFACLFSLSLNQLCSLYSPHLYSSVKTNSSYWSLKKVRSYCCLSLYFVLVSYAVVWRQTAVTAYLKSKHLLLFAFTL